MLDSWRLSPNSRKTKRNSDFMDFFVGCHETCHMLDAAIVIYENILVFDVFVPILCSLNPALVCLVVFCQQDTVT